jgi:cytochrome c-type biogenesis protein CcmH/NrfF
MGIPQRQTELSSRAKREILVPCAVGENPDSSSLTLLGMTRTFFLRRSAQLIVLTLVVFALLGAGDESARVNDLGHRMMCVCGCNQILLECNHVGCAYSERMRAELVAAVDRGDNDDLTLQGFVQKYGTNVMATPRPASIGWLGSCPTWSWCSDWSRLQQLSASGNRVL